MNAVTEQITSLDDVQRVDVDLGTGAVTVAAIRELDESEVAGCGRGGRLRAGARRVGAAPVTAIDGAGTREVDLEIGGMTCASCAARIEKRLNRIDGVHATVNYATERAHADVPAGVNADELIAQVAAVGYTAHLPTSDQPRLMKAGGNVRPATTRRRANCRCVSSCRHSSRRRCSCSPWFRRSSSATGSG